MRAAAALALLAAVLPAPAAAQDTLREIDRTRPPYAALNGVGQVLVPAFRAGGDPAEGSGALVSACHVLTAHHVAFDRAETPASGKRAFFRVGQAAAGEREPFRHAYRIEAVAWGERERHRREADAIRRRIEASGLAETDPAYREAFGRWLVQRYLADAHDWALFRVEGGRATPYPPLPLLSGAAFADLAERPLATVGFPGHRGDADGFRRLWGQFDCRAVPRGPVTEDVFLATGAEPRLWPVACGFDRVAEGMSGGPLVAEAGGRLVLAGVYSTVIRTDRRGPAARQIGGYVPAATVSPALAAALGEAPCGR